MPKRLLIIEDNEVERVGLTGVLTSAGFHVSAARNSQDARHSARAERPHMVLLDMIMPVHDGWEFLDMRKDDASLSSIPVIVVTGLPWRVKSGLMT